MATRSSPTKSCTIKKSAAPATNSLLAGSVSICLKPSSTSDASPGGVCTNGSGATWPNGATVTQTFSLSPSLVLDNSGLEIDLFQHYSWPDTANNWDIQ